MNFSKVFIFSSPNADQNMDNQALSMFTRQNRSTPQKQKQNPKSSKGAQSRAPFGIFHYIFLSFDRSGSHAFHVEALHEDEQDRDRDGDQHTARGERHEQRVRGCAGHHREQPDRDRVVRDVVAHDDFCEDEVHPRSHEGQQ